MTDENGKRLDELTKQLSERVSATLLTDIDERIEERISRLKAEPTTMQLFMLWVGLITGIISILAVVFSTGKFVQQFASLSQSQIQLADRISMLEQGGSFGLKQHAAMDDARDTSTRERLAAVEQALSALPRLETSTVRMLTLIEAMQKQIDKRP